MSHINKAKDRNEKGKINPKYTGNHNYFNTDQSPSWWTNMFMNRPQRLLNRKLCHAVMLNPDSADGIAFPLGNNKPHEYYW